MQQQNAIEGAGLLGNDGVRKSDVRSGVCVTPGIAQPCSRDVATP